MIAEDLLTTNFSFFLQAILKPRFLGYCQSERSEELRIFKWLRFFTPFGMTEKLVLN
jgi:hypothetical protein